MQIRAARDDDLPALTAIYNEVILTSTAVYADQVVTAAERGDWLFGRRRQAYPVLVADAAGEVVGFSSFGDFRAWPGYRHTVEHTVHVRADRRGQGVGAMLLSALFPLASALDKHVMIGAVDAANTASIRFHERLGFARVGHLREVGRKFDRWLDLVLLQRFLDGE